MNSIRSSIWRYVSSADVADGYDEYFSDNPLFVYDTKLLEKWFSHPGRLIDLGCGTGRHLVPFARRGFCVTGVDLSAPMVRVARSKLAGEGLSADVLRANLLDLRTYVAPSSFDHAIMMFSTLGLIAGTRNRYRLLRQVHRILEPGGQLALHVHSRWHNLWYPDGWVFLASNGIRTLLGADEWGDKYLSHYRGIDNMFIHLFSRREVCYLLERAGFAIRHVVCLNRGRTGELHPSLRSRRLLTECLANGFILLAQARTE